MILGTNELATHFVPLVKLFPPVELKLRRLERGVLNTFIFLESFGGVETSCSFGLSCENHPYLSLYLVVPFDASLVSKTELDLDTLGKELDLKLDEEALEQSVGSFTLVYFGLGGISAYSFLTCFTGVETKVSILTVFGSVFTSLDLTRFLE